MSWVTVDDVKAFGGVSGTELDTRIQDYINLVEGYIKLKAGWDIEAKNYREVIYTVDKRVFLSNFPVISITKVTINDYEVGEDNYYVDKDTGSFWFKGIPRAGDEPYKIEVEYRAGYEAIPEDIKTAIKMEVVKRLQMQDGLGVKNINRGGETINFRDDEMGKNVQNIVDIYKRYKRVYSGIVTKVET